MNSIVISFLFSFSVPCECNISDSLIAPAVTVPVMQEDIFLSDEGERLPVVPADIASSNLLLGGLITLGAIFVAVPIILGFAYYHAKISKQKSETPVSRNETDTKKASLTMKDFHYNTNLLAETNGMTASKGKVYGYPVMDEEINAMYQEPYKGALLGTAYYTMSHHSNSHTLEGPLRNTSEAEDSVDYAVPEMTMTPPPPSFSDTFSIPPPIPLSRPPTLLRSRSRLETPPPVPTIPPPPEQKYYATSSLCRASNIQGVTGSVIYSVVDPSMFKKECTVQEVLHQNVRVLENIGEGIFGLVQLCEVNGLVSSMNHGSFSSHDRLYAMKSLKPNASESAKNDFREEVKILSQLDDPNIVKLMGVMMENEPLAMILEYMEHGDLYQFLRRHVLEGSSPRISLPSGCNPANRVLSQGALIYMAMQISSGMKYLESLNFVHRDLASRNCLVGLNLTIKISDFGMSRPLYSNDYYIIEGGRTLLPIRWMAWESILHGRFTVKSDVWAFAVTLWEILTLARKQPYEELTNEGVLENISHCYNDDGSGMILLPQPVSCQREIYEMMTACWRFNEKQRPTFREIFLFLQRKNIGYSIDYRE